MSTLIELLRRLFTFSGGVMTGVILTVLALGFLLYVADVVANAWAADEEASL